MHEIFPPALCFVGRPLDPQKGLITFLDALDRLLALPERPVFAVWIVGGDEDEIPKIVGLINGRPELRNEFLFGRLIVWGKMKRNALAEMYKRSLVVVMPSQREPFGLVAIEAMACKTPVIGTRQGGLSDTILEGLTGLNVEVDSPECLAAAVLLYLRGRNICRMHGRLAASWSSHAFDKETAYAEMASLYLTNSVPYLAEPGWTVERSFHENQIIQNLNRVETGINERIIKWQLVSAKHHIIARVETKRNQFALKVFRERPRLTAAILPIGLPPSTRTPQDFVDNARYHATNPVAVPAVSLNRKHGFVVFEWIDAISIPPMAEQLRSLRKSFDEFAATQQSARQEHGAYQDAVEVFLRERDETSLVKLDYTSAALNKAIQNIQFDIRATHPMAELQRLMLCLETKGWPIPPDICDRIRMTVALVQSKWTDCGESPKLRHGDLQKRHVVERNGRLAVLDTEHSVYAVGELDIGTYSLARFQEGSNMFNIVAEIRDHCGDEKDRVTALQWTTYFLVLWYLTRVHRGEISESSTRIRRALSDLTLAVS